jgi:hypothetical protein
VLLEDVLQSVTNGCGFSKSVTHVDLGVSFFEEPIDQLFKKKHLQ